MKLYIDGDGCNARSRTFMLGFAMRGVLVEMVSNVPISVPAEVRHCTQYHARVVGSEQGAVDSYVLKYIRAGDALITRDLVFARDALARGAWVASDYGESYDNQTIDARIVSSEARKGLRTYTRDMEQLAGRQSKRKKARQLKARLRELSSFLSKWLQNGNVKKICVDVH